MLEKQPPPLDGLDVLIVEDDDDARDLLAEVLSYCGAIVTAPRLGAGSDPLR